MKKLTLIAAIFACLLFPFNGVGAATKIVQGTEGDCILYKHAQMNQPYYRAWSDKKAGWAAYGKYGHTPTYFWTTVYQQRPIGMQKVNLSVQDYCKRLGVIVK